jgi:hypothetical protein
MEIEIENKQEFVASKGLSSVEAGELLHQHGRNELAEVKKSHVRHGSSHRLNTSFDYFTKLPYSLFSVPNHTRATARTYAGHDMDSDHHGSRHNELS